MKTYTICYEIDGYNCTHDRFIKMRAHNPKNALARALMQIGGIRGCIADAKKYGGRVRYRVGGYSRNLWAWVVGHESYVNLDMRKQIE